MKFIFLSTIIAILTVILILNEWKKITKGVMSRFVLDTLRMSKILSNIWPSDTWFLSLVYSTIRHWFVSILSILAIVYIDNILLFIFLFTLNFAYIYLKRPLYTARKHEWENIMQQNTTEFFINSKRACDYTKIYTYIAHLLFVMAYIFL